MLSLIALILIPLLVGGIAAWHFRTTITLPEYGLMVAIIVPLIVLSFYTARWGALQDTEFWNGRITAKNFDTQHCCHCHEECDTCTRTRTDSKGKTKTESYSCRCREVCQHSRDYEWSLSVSTGDHIGIRSCEPNPANVPLAWQRSYINEPATVPHMYTNYLLADKDSILLRVSDEELLKRVPAEPTGRDYYKATKVLTDGIRVGPEWNDALMELNASVGEANQVDVRLLFTTYADPDYALAVEAAWALGPKNGLTVIVGVAPDGVSFAWVRVVSMSKGEEIKVSLRDALLGKSLTDVSGVMSIIQREVNGKFKRTPMAEWEYLSAMATPSGPRGTRGMTASRTLSVPRCAWISYAPTTTECES